MQTVIVDARVLVDVQPEENTFKISCGGRSASSYLDNKKNNGWTISQCIRDLIQNVHDGAMKKAIEVLVFK